MPIITKPWTRRRFLQAAGLSSTAAALLPFVPSLRASAQEVGTPKRLVLFTSTNGTNLSLWRDNGAGGAFPTQVGSAAIPALRGTILSPLDPLRERLTLIDGLDLQSGYFDNDSGALQKGHAGTCLLWSGARGGAEVLAKNGWSKERTIDHIVAERIGPNCRAPVLHLGTFPGDGLIPEKVHSFDAPERPFGYQNDAQLVFNQLWGGGGGGDTGGDPDAGVVRRRRILAESRSQLARLRTQLIEEDRDRLDRHTEALATLEARLSAPVAPGCTAPDTNFRAHTMEQQDIATDYMLEIGRLALQCDLTRVFHFAFMREGNGGGASFIQNFGNSNVHSVSHLARDEDAARQRMARLQAFIAQKIAGFWQGLGPAADQTLAAWGMSMSHAGVHSSRNIPFVVLQGSGLNSFRSNRYVRTSNYAQTPGGARVGGGSDYTQAAAPPHNHLLVSICHTMGLTGIQDVGGLASRIPSGPLEAAMV